jgi:hypothetical protein
LDVGREPGGIIKVVELIDDHTPAFAYDFRYRFGLGLDDLGEKVPWHEVVYLVSVLIRDPSSWLQTSINNWHHPVSFEWAALAAQYDLHAQVNSKRKPKPYPRPWKDAGGGSNRKGTARSDAREILAKARNGGVKWQSRRTPT